MAKKFKSGICIGKFMPIHKGHIHMIEEGAKQCDVMHVLICTREVEPIEGNLRYQWAKEIFKGRDDVKVLHCTDENPQYPEDDPKFWDIWYESTYAHVPVIDAVFASEDYVYPFAELLDAVPVLVDKERGTVPISGTEIRENPFDNWRYIPKVVRPYYRKTIAIVGPESTGKSTLTKTLADYNVCEHIEEYGRYYTENVVAASDLTSKDFEVITERHWEKVVQGQINSEGRFLFLDTEAIVTLTFAKMYLGDTLEAGTELYLDMHIKHQIENIDLYLLCEPDLEWDDDGTRDFDKQDDRSKHYHMIKDILDKRGAKYEIINGEGDQRNKNATWSIENSLITK